MKFYTSVAKELKLKSQKLFPRNSYVCRSDRGKTGKGKLFALPPPSPHCSYWKSCNTLCKICQNADFPWPAFSRIFCPVTIKNWTVTKAPTVTLFPSLTVKEHFHLTLFKCVLILGIIMFTMYRSSLERSVKRCPKTFVKSKASTGDVLQQLSVNYYHKALLDVATALDPPLTVKTKKISWVSTQVVQVAHKYMNHQNKSWLMLR